MSDKEKQYYIKLHFEFGVDNGDGTFTVKNSDDKSWVSMTHAAAVGLEAYALVPAVNLINTEAINLGLMAAGLSPIVSDDKVAPVRTSPSR